jgi:hypothetical protein
MRPGSFAVLIISYSDRLILAFEARQPLDNRFGASGRLHGVLSRRQLFGGDRRRIWLAVPCLDAESCHALRNFAGCASILPVLICFVCS